MTTPTPVSRYQQRIDRVQKIVQVHTKLDNTKARALATDMVHVLDTVPETVR
ncbi:DUF6307 family protein [Amycolatopsis sp. NBC_00345]|uniref:DUF6307 family protein n=1 Tax=Amycolatopsis sp. NBC_00345 TaxID=2975955 RepID=UPI002E259D15